MFFLLPWVHSFMNHEWMDEESTSGLKTGRVEFGLFCIFPYQNTILMTGTCHESLAHDFNTNQPYRPAINSWFLRKHPVEFEKGIEAWRSLWEWNCSETPCNLELFSAIAINGEYWGIILTSNWNSPQSVIIKMSIKTRGEWFWEILRRFQKTNL